MTRSTVMIHVVAGLLLFHGVAEAGAGSSDLVAKKQDPSLKYEVEHSIQKGLHWLEKKQN